MRASIGLLILLASSTAASPILSIPFASQLLNGSSPSARISSASLLFFTPGVRVSPDFTFSIGLLPNSFIFSSPNPSNLACSAFLSLSRNPLPDWLSFDPETLTFDGKATSTAGSLNVTVVCWELDGSGMASDWFLLQTGDHTLEVGTVPTINAMVGNHLHFDASEIATAITLDGEQASESDRVALNIDASSTPWLSWNSSSNILDGFVPADDSLASEDLMLHIVIQDGFGDMVTFPLEVHIEPSAFIQHQLPRFTIASINPQMIDLRWYLRTPADPQVLVTMEIANSDFLNLSNWISFNSTSLILATQPDPTQVQANGLQLPTATLLFTAHDATSNWTSISSMEVVARNSSQPRSTFQPEINTTIYLALVCICSTLVLVAIGAVVLWWVARRRARQAVDRIMSWDASTTKTQSHWDWEVSELGRTPRKQSQWLPDRTFATEEVGAVRRPSGGEGKMKVVGLGLSSELYPHRRSVRLVLPHSEEELTPSPRTLFDEPQDFRLSRHSVPRSVTPGLELLLSRHASIRDDGACIPSVGTPRHLSGTQNRETIRSPSHGAGSGTAKARRNPLQRLRPSRSPRSIHDRPTTSESYARSGRDVSLSRRSNSSTDTADNDIYMMIGGPPQPGESSDPQRRDSLGDDATGKLADRQLPSGSTELNELSRGMSAFNSVRSNHLPHYLNSSAGSKDDNSFSRVRDPSSTEWRDDPREDAKPSSEQECSDIRESMSDFAATSTLASLESPVRRFNFTFGRHDTADFEQDIGLSSINIGPRSPSRPRPLRRLSTSYSAGPLPLERNFYDSSPEASPQAGKKTQDRSEEFNLTPKWDFSLRGMTPHSASRRGSPLNHTSTSTSRRNPLPSPFKISLGLSGQSVSKHRLSGTKDLSKTWEY